MMKTAAPLTSPVQPSKTNKKVINEMISELKWTTVSIKSCN